MLNKAIAPQKLCDPRTSNLHIPDCRRRCCSGAMRIADTNHADITDGGWGFSARIALGPDLLHESLQRWQVAIRHFEILHRAK